MYKEFTMTLLTGWFRIPLWIRVLGGLALGLATGLIWGPEAASLKPIGDFFLEAIRMLIVPLILTSLVAGVTTLGNPADLGRIGIKTMGWYLVTMVVAIIIGLLLANLLQPGAGTRFADMSASVSEQKSVNLVDVFLSIVPSNIVKAMAETDVLGLISFSVLLGIAIVAVGEKAEPVKAVFKSGSEIVFKMTHWVLELAPFGVFALMAWVAGTNGPAVLLPLAKLVLTLYIGCILHILLVSGVLVGLLARLNVFRFFKNIVDALLVAFSTATSNGTLPVSMRCAQEKMGVDKGVASFVLPLGATVNMDGTVMHFGILAVFAAQIFGVDLSFAQYAAIILVSLLAAIGAAGVPSASLILIPMVLTTAGFSIEHAALITGLIAGIDRVMDMARTATNVLGDLIVCALVGKSEKALDEKIYYAQHPTSSPPTSSKQ
jgi:Na+/H+-dicarboxylate symporter